MKQTLIFLAALLLAGSSGAMDLPGMNTVADLLLQFDANNDGSLDRDEFETAVSRGFVEMDKSYDNKITEVEIEGLAEPISRQWGDIAGSAAAVAIKSILLTLDANGDKVLSEAEYEQGCDRCFGKLDANRDDRLSRDEIKSLPVRLLFAKDPVGAGKQPPTLSIKAGRGKTIEMTDTSDATRGLDLAKLKLELLYEIDFSKPLKFVKEAELFTDGKRARKPEGTDWVLEGKASARVENGRLFLKNDAGHLVFWNTREFPADLLIEFGVSPADSNKGLNIVFFAAKGRDGGSIFDLSQPMRDGEFKTYHSGEINNYHTSYWAITSGGEARGTSHIRKNHGFHLVAMGRDFIAGQGAGPHCIRVLKLGNQITVEANGKIEVRWEDDGKTFGPVLKEGYVSLRQMSHTGECSYTHFKVWAARQ
ncbi:MAG: DUF1961 family protein [Verrucomicrobia bacterium]|nr:DUF1961 family protein [Verrucomicrobiota bacterium]